MTSPYLPTSRSALRERAIRIRYRITYYIWKRMIMKYAKRHKAYPDAFSLLEIGCGPGNLLCCLECWFPSATIAGIDICVDLLRYASKRLQKVRLLLGSAESLPIEEGSFDVIAVLQVVEHLKEPEAFLKQLYRSLRTDGLLLLATPNPIGLAARLLGENWQGIRYDHISLKAPLEWRAILERAGFTIKEQGTTLLNGIPMIGRFPLGFPFQIAQALCGWFPWRLGESYMVVAQRH